MQVIAHRGASAVKPENTLTAIEQALALNVSAIELDVHLLHDQGEKHLVIMHDRYVDGTTNGVGRITDHSYAHLRGLDAGMGQQIPVLQEALACISGRCEVHIELKNEGAVPLVLSEINDFISTNIFTEDQFVISSFDHLQLIECQQIQPSIRRGALIAHIPHDLASFTDNLGLYSLNLSINCINKALVDDAHQRGLKVLVYTVDKPADIEQMLTYKVDGIFSNAPDAALNYITEQHG